MSKITNVGLTRSGKGCFHIGTAIKHPVPDHL